MDSVVTRRVRDGLALNRKPWLGVAVALVLVLVIGGIFLAIWATSHHNSLASDMTGEWQAAAQNEATLSIYPGDPNTSYDTLTKGLFVEGSIGGRPVKGVIAVPKWPPWGSSVQASLLGQQWSLRPERAQHRLVLTSASGETIVLEGQ
jgi:hypothetical protein